MLQIPKITENYISQGFKTIDQTALLEPNMGLNFFYPDCVMFALLLDIQNPTRVLDLGSYFGLLPILTEQLHKLYGTGKKFQWTLIDNCSYVKELSDFIKGQGPFTGAHLKNRHLETWKLENIKKEKQHFFESTDRYCIPPSTPEEFHIFWKKFTDHHKFDNPNKEMFTGFDTMPKDRKFELAMFDLSSENFDVNKRMFELLVNEYGSDDIIVVMDDISPQHPNSMALFNYILDTTDFLPLAFSTNKIAIQRKKFKDNFIFKRTVEAGHHGLGSPTKDIPQTYFNFFFRSAYKWGDYLNLGAR